MKLWEPEIGLNLYIAEVKRFSRLTSARTPVENLAARYLVKDGDGTQLTRSICTLMDLGGTCSVERILNVTCWGVAERAPEILRQILLITEEDDGK
jgi:hypothetical protein